MELETNNIIVGTGLISLDVLIWEGNQIPVSYYVGGTCGNVMMILSYMGWDAYPIARLDGTKDGVRVLDDMKKHHVHTDFVSTQDGKTPVIVQRNLINKDGIPTHKFESRNNAGRFYLDFKSLTLPQAKAVIERIDFVPKVFFFDRVSPAILKLATTFKGKGSVIFFEPSSRGGNVILFNKCIEVADIVKFSEQRIKNIEQFKDYRGKVFIQTQGANGLSYRLDSSWKHLDPVVNEKVVDTAGAGDWTAAALINYLFKDKVLFGICNLLESDLETALKEAQKVGAESCSYEGARGMMQMQRGNN
ncbi:MAG: PfkB family carbohydrate kinase [Bacteroidales bacterium]|nr:PfkB family carbohydrate kinase [Bacteroidales bacterium]